MGGEYDRAIENFNKAIKLNPKFADPYNDRGLSYKNKDFYDLPIKDYTKAIELAPDFAEAYNSRGNAYRNLGDYNQAIQDHTSAIRMNPDLAEAYNDRGILYKELSGDRERGCADLRKAFDLGLVGEYLWSKEKGECE